MFVIRHLTQINQPLALTIGNFDGVHLGHAKIIDDVKQIAKEKKLKSAILTFEPHPVSFFQGGKANNFRITSLAQKLEIFRQKQIDYVIVLPFNQKTSNLSATDFVKYLSHDLNTKNLTVGYDFSFGKNRQGDFAFLQNISSQFDLMLNRIEAVGEDNQIFSSSMIRKLISAGKIHEANQLLGKNFMISGLVKNGRKLANQLGFPTANLFAKPQVIKPKFGVYKTLTSIAGSDKKWPSITNFGVKPTITQDSEQLFETHILGFSGDIYGKKINVEFIDFAREEKKFASIDELKEQIRRDILHIS